MFKYSIKSLLSKKTISILFIIAMCVAISISMLSINISSQIEEGFYQVDKKYDVVVGPTGSSTQLVMSSLFLSDDPLGTIDEEYLEKIQDKYSFNKIVPLAMADSYKGNRIVGSTVELLEDYSFKAGQIFDHEFEMVVGSNIAKRYNLAIGDKLITSHGTSTSSEEHHDSPYTLVGILEETNTAYDNTAFTSVESVWGAHEHSHEEEEDHEEENEANEHEEQHDDDHSHEMGYTALLIKSGNLATANKLESDFNDDSQIQVVNTTKILRKLMNNIDMSKQVALLLCGIIITLAVVLTCVMSFLMLTNSKKDIKLLSFLGMKKNKIYGYNLYQVGILTAISVLISVIINRAVLSVVNNISSSMGIVLDLTKIYIGEINITFVYVILILVSTIVYTYTRLKKED